MSLKKCLGFGAAFVTLAGIGAAAVMFLNPTVSEKFVLKQAAGGFKHFIERPSETEMIQVTRRIYAFQWLHYTSMVVEGEKGLIVIDPANARSAGLLKQELDKRFPGKKVTTLIYSHEHKDHAEGGKVFGAREIIAHKDVPAFLADFPGHDVVPPTRLLEGKDQELEVEGMKIQFIYLPHSHTNTLFGILLPSEKTLYLADLAVVDSMPFILMELYMPGVIRALEKLSGYDFDHYVASHFRPGHKKDVLYSLQLMRDIRAIAWNALKEKGPVNDKTGYAIQEKIYDDLRAKYGHLHGFSDVYIPFITRMFLGEFVGF